MNWEAAGEYHSGTLHKKHGVVSERQIGPHTEANIATVQSCAMYVTA